MRNEFQQSNSAVKRLGLEILQAQTSLKPLFDAIQYRWDEPSQSLRADLAAVIMFRDGTTWSAQDIATILVTPDPVRSLNDVLVGTGNADSLDGGQGIDQIAGNGGNDVIQGGAGNDLLMGGGQLDAFRFNLEPVAGANGNDTYIFRRGDGQDTLIDLDPTANTDTLKLVGITPAEVSGRYQPVDADYADLVLDLGQGDVVTIKQALARDGIGQGRIERIEFDDGTVWVEESRRDRRKSHLRDWRYGDIAGATVPQSSNGNWRVAA